ncbi:MAG: DUF4129 domain-containing protein [Thaumarchaeota archaeon]|nr:DUF4129 domain-containing protein [Nitrososphaerota archaeon]
MPATPENAGIARRWLAVSLAAALMLVACFGALAAPAHAADDSNAGQLAQAPTVSPSQLGSTLGTLAQGTNDTQLQQLLSQFQSQLSSGNNSEAASTLGQLQNLTASQPGAVSPSLNALLNSLSVGSNGASVNSGLLASLLNTGPSGSGSGESSQKLSVDMQSLAGLMQYANSTLASELLQNSSLLSQSGFGGNAGISVGGAPVALPGLSGLPGISIPSAGAPSLSLGTPSASIPSISLTAFAIPLVVAGMVAALYFSRGRVVRLVGSQSLPGMTLMRGAGDDEREAEAVPSDPRKRIEFYFGRAVRLMGRRGVPKLESETHREFSAKCEGTPERPHVVAISTLYEKAKFSGQEVGRPDADLAASELLAMGKEER